MNKYFLAFHRSFFVIVFSLIVFIGFSFLPKSAEMKSESASPEQVISPLKRLSFSQSVATFGSPNNFLRSINADNSDEQLLSDFTSAVYIESVWSPDGTKIAHVTFFPSADIFVVNADGTNRIPLASTMDVDERNPSWSVTGKIAYERGEEIWTMNGNGTNQILFSSISQPSPKAPKWSPDGSKIAFSSGGEIWVINADGTNEQQVTNNSTMDAEPDWSPNGLKLVYQKGSTGIAVINLDGTNETNLTNGTDDRTPAWSNDNTKIAFVRRGTSVNGIYLMDITGGNQLRLRADDQGTRPILHFDPAWRPVLGLEPNTFTISGRITKLGVGLGNVVVNLSGTANAAATIDAVGNYQFSNLPVGGNYTLSPSFTNNFFTPANQIFNNLSSDRIADFTAAETCSTPTCVVNGRIAYSGSGIVTINPDGSDKVNLGNGTEVNYSWDGSKIVFSSNRDGNYEIYKMNADGSSVVRLTNNSTDDSFPAFSPDGQSIVYHSNREGNTGIFKMNADGTNEVRLTNEPGDDVFPSFSPDGSKIIFARNVVNSVERRNLYTMNPDGSNQTILPTPIGFYSPPSYSPDGTKIIFNYGDNIMTQSIHTANSDGSNFVSVTSGINGVSYSPDGNKIVFRAFAGSGLTSIFTAEANGTNRVQITPLGDGELPAWQPIRAPRRVQFDFDGDERADVSVFRPSDTVWYVLNSSGGFSTTQFGFADDILTPADYDGDLKTDIAVWRNSNGNFYISNSSNGTVTVENFGLPGDIPTVGDWDGDGKADLSVYRDGAQSLFYYLASSNNPNGNISSIPWGIAGDKPVSGDFDGDGQMDAAVFRPSNGVWYIRKSSDGQLLAYGFGLATDKLVPADYDGDRKTDIAVYRDGIWYALRSSDGGVNIVPFGNSTDVPTPADYDGDGKADIAVFRPSDGIWYLLQTTNGFAGLQFGLETDKPIPSVYSR